MRKLLSIIILFMSISMYAQQTVVLDTIELVGVRANEQTPITSKIITSKEIQRAYSGQELPMLLNSQPSITTNTDGGHPQGYTYFRLRGIDQTRINMTLNGVPLNEPEDQGVYFSNYPNFAKNIKSMQIQRGVGTSTNGVSSFAGSINFESFFGTKKQTDLELEYGSYNTSRVGFTYGSGFSKNDKWSTFLNLSGFKTDGYKYHSGSKGYSGFLGIGYYGESETIKFTGFTGASNNEMAWFAVSEDDISTDPRTNYNSPDADDNFRQSLAMLEYKKTFDSDNNLSFTGFYNRLDGDWDLYVGDMLNFQLFSNFYGVISNYNYTPNNLNINVGVSTNMYNRNHIMGILPIIYTEVYNNTGYKNEFSTYGKVEWNLEQLTLFTDLQYRNPRFRYEGSVDLENQTWNFFNPKVGATLNIVPNLKVYGSIGKSHREPTRSDMFGGEDDLIDFIEVTPEEVVDYEIGLKLKSKYFDFNGNYYYMDFENEITLLGSLGSYSLQNFGNVDKSYRSGVEVDLNIRLHKEVTIKYNGAYSRNRIQHDGITFQPLYTPTLIQNMALNLHRGGMFIEFAVQHRNKSFLDFSNENTVPAFASANLVMGYENEKIAVKVSGINISNTEYYTNGYMDGGVKYLYVNAPASIYGSVTFKF